MSEPMWSLSKTHMDADKRAFELQNWAYHATLSEVEAIEWPVPDEWIVGWKRQKVADGIGNTQMKVAYPETPERIFDGQEEVA